MSRTSIIKQGFSHGMVDETFAENFSSESYRRSAKTLRNVIVQKSEGVIRRDGFQFINTTEPGILIPVDQKAKIIMFMGEENIHFYRNGKKIYSRKQFDSVTSKTFEQVSRTQLRGYTIICCGDLPPLWLALKYIEEHDRYNVFITQLFLTYLIDSNLKYNYQTFISNDAPLLLTRSVSRRTVTLTLKSSFGQAVFETIEAPYPKRLYLKILGHPVRVYNYVSNKEVTLRVGTGHPLAEIDDGTTITDWKEQDFSYTRGWPRHCAFHRNRLILAGSRIFPNDIWVSRIDQFNDFDSSDILDDAPIHIRLAAENSQGIHKIISRNDGLYVFAGEDIWRIDGESFSASAISAQKIGEFVVPKHKSSAFLTLHYQIIAPDHTGKKLWATDFNKTAVSSEKTDLTIATPHLLEHPRALNFDASESRFFMITQSGNIATMLSQETPAWSFLETKGTFQEMALVGNDLYVLTKRGEHWAVEMMHSSMLLDSAISLSSNTSKSLWQDAQLKIFEAENVYAICENGHFESVKVENARVQLSQETKALQIGYPFTHDIEPLPTRTFHALPELVGLAPHAIRPLRFRLLLSNTAHCRIDIGNDLTTVPLQNIGTASKGAFGRFSGEKILRGLGWIKDSEALLWRISQEDPGNFTLRSVWTEIRTPN